MEKQYDHKNAEAQAQALWEQEQTYRLPEGQEPVYSIDTPPPTVSGNLHIGHVFSYTQTDIIARYKRLKGFRVFYPFGFDDNGLPTERYVEKKRDIAAFKLSRSEFIKLCLEETHEAEEQFKSLWQKIGLSADWNKCYSTISDSTRKLSQESFILLYKKGFIYRKNEPALFCTTCRTSVAQAELDDVEKPSTFNDIVFKDNFGNELIVATTRPELLPSVVALLYHPNDIRYQNLRDRQALVPLFGQTVPILPDEGVIKEKGTGLVMVSTFGDKTDIAWFKKHNLPYRPMMDVGGKFTEKAGIIAGLSIAHARPLVLDELKKADLLRAQRPINHMVNVHERCKREIEYFMLPQWFLNILDYKKEFISLGKQINWYPAHMQSRYSNWVENLSWDWCLSRQRFFGIPFPAWHCKDCGEILLASIDQLPIDPQEHGYPGGACTACGSSNLTPDTDVMDTWNTSSITPYICYALYANTTDNVFDAAGREHFIPMSMRPQAHDIIRTWAFDTIVKAWMHDTTIPWFDIVISGHVLSTDKEKLSKSKGNTALSPQHLLETHSADAIRYWTASGALGSDIAFSEGQIKIGQRLITKLWNAFRFIGEHTQGINLIEAYNPNESLGVINEWILHEASTTFTRYTADFERHEFSLALNWIEKFFWTSFCDNYLEIVKDQLFKPENYTPQQVAATRWTLYSIGMRLLQWYAPYLPHITETIYGHLYKQQMGHSSLHRTSFAKAQAAFTFPQSAAIMNMLLEIIAQVRRLKTEKQLSLKTPLIRLHISLPEPSEINPLIMEHEQLLRGVCQAEEIKWDTSTTQKPSLEPHETAWIAHVVVGAASS